MAPINPLFWRALLAFLVLPGTIAVLVPVLVFLRQGQSLDALVVLMVFLLAVFLLRVVGQEPPVRHVPRTVDPAFTD